MKGAEPRRESCVLPATAAFDPYPSPLKCEGLCGRPNREYLYACWEKKSGCIQVMSSFAHSLSHTHPNTHPHTLTCRFSCKCICHQAELLILFVYLYLYLCFDVAVFIAQFYDVF